MVRINVVPLKEVNGIKFGMKRAEVRKIWGEAREFKKSKFSKITTDDFGFCHVFYNTNDECEAVEIFEDVEVVIDGRIIFPGEIDTEKAAIDGFIEEDGSWINAQKSIGIYAPDKNMESILFGIKGYYE